MTPKGKPPTAAPTRKAVTPSAASPKKGKATLGSVPKSLATLFSPDVLWRIGIDTWVKGDPAYVERLLSEDKPIPRFARAWIADALAGAVKHKRGRKIERPTIAAMAEQTLNDWVVLDQFRYCVATAKLTSGQGRDGTPTERALEECANRCGMSVDSVSRIVFPRKARNSGK